MQENWQKVQYAGKQCQALEITEETLATGKVTVAALPGMWLVQWAEREGPEVIPHEVVVDKGSLFFLDKQAEGPDGDTAAYRKQGAGWGSSTEVMPPGADQEEAEQEEGDGETHEPQDQDQADPDEADADGEQVESRTPSSTPEGDSEDGDQAPAVVTMPAAGSLGEDA